MIAKIREWTLPLMIIILVSFVIGTIFLNWGMNRGAGGTRTNSAGKINGQDVPLNYFDHAVNSERQRLEQSGNSSNPYQVHQLPYEVWEKEVNQVLMSEFFKKALLFGSPDEVFDYVKHNPPPGVDTNSMFMTSGRFDTSKWASVLNDPRTFEYNPSFRVLEQQTSEMVIPEEKLQTLLLAAALPTKAEVEYLFKTQNEKAVFEYAGLKSEAVKVDFSTITEAKVSAYYSSHRDQFKSDEQVDLYTVKIPKKITERDEKLYVQELLDIKKKLLAEKGTPLAEAFADEAKVSSEDEGTAQNGGDLGLFKKGAMVPEFDSVAFKLDSGTISDPFKTKFGYHIVLVEKREKHGDTISIKARHILIKLKPSGETIDALQEKCDSLRKQMVDAGFLKTIRAAAQKDPSIVFDSTGLFPRNSPVPGIGYVSGLGHFLYGQTAKEDEGVSERLENNDGFYLFAVIKKIPKGILPLEAAKPNIVRHFADSLRKEAVKSAAEEWSKKLDPNTPLADLKKTDSTAIISGVTDTVSRMSFVPSLGPNSPAAAVAFALPVGKRSKLIDNNGTYVLVRPLWKGPEAVLPWGSPMVQGLMGQIINQTRQKIYMEWYENYKAKQKIVSNIEQIYVD